MANSRKKATSRRLRPPRLKVPPSDREQGSARHGPDFTFVDLFAGIGGFRWALEKQLGGRCVFSSEWDSFCAVTYAANFEEAPDRRDIRGISPSIIPQHDLLAAGFPCQPFSIAGVSKKRSLGRPHGFDDAAQGNLFFAIEKIIGEKRPKAFLLENVRNLRSHDQGRTFKTIINILVHRLGYDVHWKVLDARHVVPQHRERIFIVGFERPCDFAFPSFTAAGPVLGEILEPSDDKTKGYRLSGHLWRYLKMYAAKHRAAGNGFGFGLVGAQDVARTLSARYYKDGSEILVNRGRGRVPRRLTPRECARLMGFPEEFKIPVSDTQAYKQFGNSVVVPLVGAVAARVLRCLKGETFADEICQPGLFSEGYSEPLAF